MEIKQFAVANARLPPLKVIVLPPMTPLTAPPHCGVAGTAASVMPPGKVSVKLKLACAGLPVPFATVNDSVEVPPSGIAVGEKALVSVVPRTFKVSVKPVADKPPARPDILPAAVFA